MGIVEVDAGDGRRWTVRRRFRWPRLRLIGPDEKHDSIVDLAAGLGVLGIIVLVVATIVFFVLPFVVFVAEALVALAAVLLLRGTWSIEATTDGPPPQRKTWKVRGPFRSKRAVEEVAAELRAGVPAAPEKGDPATAG